MMKNKFIAFSMSVFLMMLLSTDVLASFESNALNHQTTSYQENNLGSKEIEIPNNRLTEKQQKSLAKVKKKLAKKGFSSGNSDNNWLWLGVLGLAIGAALYLIAKIVSLLGLVPLLGGLFTLAGVICIIVWLWQKFM